FLGHLFLQRVVSMNVIHFCIVDLLSSIAIDKDGHRTYSDRIALKRRSAAKAEEAAAGSPLPSRSQPFPFDKTFSTLAGAMPIVSSRIRFMIMNLMELRTNRWVPRKMASDGPKKLIEINNEIRKEQAEKIQAMEALFENLENEYEESEYSKHWREKYEQLEVEKEETERKYR
ncbi:hypothetical protein PENTCL1PPCAC_12437, partial [Pristionchus entomophagus]